LDYAIFWATLVMSQDNKHSEYLRYAAASSSISSGDAIWCPKSKNNGIVLA
jgi:hypothetical protein